ncbi:uncharacterized protein [Haliotis cracherodii]|uniref:uncharacterized protein n=1 Tax=Haliotis cracherodii TaxID=6455 RepID=UPI0039E78D5F
MPVEDTVMCRKSVLYIGSSVPLETSEGLEAIQQPLKEHYPVEEGSTIDGMKSTLTVLPTGLQLLLNDDDSGTIIWFPITSLTLCAAVRCINTVNTATGEKVAKFVSLSSPAAGGANSRRPAIFTAITRRTKGKKVLECHGFVCESARDSLELVQKTSTADKMSKARINGTVLSPTPSFGVENVPNPVARSHGLENIVTPTVRPESNTILRSSSGMQDYPVRLISGERRPVSTNGVAPEFMDNPPEHGYFYSTKTSKVKKYTVDPVSDVEGDYLNASSHAPFAGRPAGDRRSVYSQPVTVAAMPPGASMTLPHPRPAPVIPIRAVPPPPPTVIAAPPHIVRRGRFFSPPPTLMRPRMIPGYPRQDPHVFMPPPPVFIDAPYVIKRRPQRRGSHSSGSGSGSSRSSSPRNIHDETFPKRTMNGDNGDLSSELSSRPRTPPTDYESRPRGPRISRREDYDLRHRPPLGAFPSNGFAPPPQHGYYMYGPQRYPYMPMYVEGRARSVPPPEGKGKKGKKNKKNKKEKKSKKRVYGIPSDSTDSYSGYMSENPNMFDRSYPRLPRDFRKKENMNMSERAFSKNLEAQSRNPHLNEGGMSAYALNEHMASRVRGEDEFHMY